MSQEETVKAPYRVFVIVDRDYGERLAALPNDEPVWIIDSPANTPVARRLWKERTELDHLRGITTFTSGPECAAEDAFINLLEDIEEHHGEYSAFPPYSILDVTGCLPSERIREALAGFGLVIHSATVDGFVALRNDKEK